MCKSIWKQIFPIWSAILAFVALMPRAFGPLCAYLRSCFGECTGVSFVDFAPLAIYHNRRIKHYKVFTDLTEREWTSMGWFYGFKLHQVVNHKSELLDVQFTSGNVDDHNPVLKLTQRLHGKFLATGDTSLNRWLNNIVKIASSCWSLSYARIRKNMKNRLMMMSNKILLRKRAVIESMIDQLKNISQIEHTRHRSPINFFVNVLAGWSLIAIVPRSLHWTSIFLPVQLCLFINEVKLLLQSNAALENGWFSNNVIILPVYKNPDYSTFANRKINQQWKMIGTNFGTNLSVKNPNSLWNKAVINRNSHYRPSNWPGGLYSKTLAAVE